MAEPSGDKLYVELPASQTRKRLKGFGHGVRKVQSAGRGRSVVIHTATGRHLEELMAQFADVECGTNDPHAGAIANPVSPESDPSRFDSNE
ncbi:MAG TPA: hypothetical protein VL175_01685 [Pirellulales bacterium]|jgi:hypothetical protein|nr:hypothetical protein [Pirellulales bacterium]